jgi:alpha-beta hydrolase superfamily lysophospholipase
MLDIEQKEKTPGRINWMRWVTPTRLVVETNQVFARATGADAVWQSWKGVVLGFDADGTNAKRLAGPDDLPEFSDDTEEAKPFSVARGSSSGFDTRVATPDRPTPTGLDELPAVAPPGEEAPPTAVSASNTRPRTLRVFDLDPARPDAVTLIATGAPRGGGSRSLGLYSLNAHTGKLTQLTDDLVPSIRTALLDRQGHARLALPNSLLASFPFRYTYLGPKGQSRELPLDAATGLTGFSVSPDNYFGTRAIPLGFDENPNLLYYAANTGRDTYGIYSHDFATGKRGGLTMENPAYDLVGPPDNGFPDQGNLVFDRFQHQLIGVRYDNALRTTAWLRPEWQTLQAEFEKIFPGRSVEITDWDETGNRFLLATQGPADPGAFFVFDRAKNKLMEFVRRAPWVDANHIHVTLPFAYATKDGARVSGLVTVPRQPHLKPIPMVVLCPDLPWQRVRSDFQTEVQALADMGFVVVQLNGRGAWGLGLKQRSSLTTGYDLVQIDDIITTIAGLEQLFKVNPKRVALLGRGHGGFIALRALQDHPDKFRCAIALNAPIDLADWLAVQRWSSDDVQPHLTRAWLGDQARLKADPLKSHPEALTKPVMMLNYPGPDGAPRRTDYAQARSFAGKVRNKGTTVEFADLTTDYMNGLPAARAAVFDRIEEFLNVNVYDFKVELKEMKIIK